METIKLFGWLYKQLISMQYQKLYKHMESQK